MGKRNRERRADKHRAAARRPQPWHKPMHRGWGVPPTASVGLDELVLDAAVRSWVLGTGAPSPQIDELAARAGSNGPAVSRALAGALLRAVKDAWGRGWQPADLVHACSRGLTKAHRLVCADAVALESRSYRYATGAHPDWMAQLAAVASDPDELSDERVLERWALRLGVEVLGVLVHLPGLPTHCAPPSAWGRARVRSASASDPKMTARVLALLAKAESTSFVEEAEALTAKAQELIAKHAIDAAMLEAGAATSEVVARRVLLDDPYAPAKSTLLSAIARANRCRSVFIADVGFSTVFGHAGDLDAVELLHASLLTQATTAMVAAGRTQASPSRTRSFRQSFLVAFAHRIGERLVTVTDTVVDEARAMHGERLLPVLAGRVQAVEDALGEAFPRLASHSMSVSNAAGWAAGRVAADLARLGPEGQLKTG